MTADQLQPGHRYTYKGGNRMGAVYAQPDGTLSLKHGGITVDWATRNRARLDYTHHGDCHACALNTARLRGATERAAGNNVVPIREDIR